jgi:hypothetical protein
MSMRALIALLVLVAACAGTVHAKIEEGVIQLDSSTTERFLSKFAFTAGAEGYVQVSRTTQTRTNAVHTFTL